MRLALRNRPTARIPQIPIEAAIDQTEKSHDATAVGFIAVDLQQHSDGRRKSCLETAGRLCRDAPTHTIVILERSEESKVCAMLRNSRFFGCASE